MKNKLISLMILILFLLTCKYDRVYKNRTFRYKIKYPKDWIALNSNHDKNRENQFKQKLESEATSSNKKFLDNYKYVNVAFYNPDSKPPLYEFITVKGEQRRFEIKNLFMNIHKLEESLMLELLRYFSNVKNVKSELQDFKKGQILYFEFNFDHKNNKYLSIFIIIPGRLFATYFFNGVCRVDDKDRFQTTFNTVLDSFYKY